MFSSKWQHQSALRGMIAVVLCACHIASVAAAPIKLACIGDSITMGIGSSNYYSTSYPGILRGLLGTGWDVQNYGHSSITVPSYSGTTEFTAAIGYLPNVVVMCLGTNDISTWSWQWHSTFISDYKALIESFKNLATHPTIYVCLPPWMSRDDAQTGYSDARLVAIFPEIQQIAQSENVGVIDLHTVTTNHPEYLTSDGLHPNDLGYQVIGQKIYNTIQPNVPYMALTDSLVPVSYYVGQPKATQTASLAVINKFMLPHYSGAVTVSKKSSWLTVFVNSTNPDSQLLVNTINPASLPDIEAKYYDTVTVNVPNATVTTMKYVVSVWVRQTSVVASLNMDPKGSGSIPSSRAFAFSATAIDQYGLPVQQSITWSATRGSVSATGLFTPSAAGDTATIIASGGVYKDTAKAFVVPCAAGLAYDYYAHTWIASVNNVPTGTPTSHGIAANISVAPTTTAADSFALRFSGYVMIPKTGSYTFYTNSDDGNALLIDGVKVVDSDGPHGAVEKSGTVSLSWGLHSISVLYFEQAYGQSLSVAWQGPGIAKGAIPDSLFYYAAGTTIVTTAKALPRLVLSDAKMVTVKKGVSISAPTGMTWELTIVSLSGALVDRCSGRGSQVVPMISRGNGCTIARLRCGASSTNMQMPKM